MSDILLTKPLPAGKIITVLDQTETGAATRISKFTIDSDSILVSLFVESLTSGTLDVEVWTETEEGKELRVIAFPTITSVTTELILRKAAACMSRVYVKVVNTGACTYEVRARGITAGELSVRIQGASQGSASSTTVTTTPAPLIPVNLNERSALIIKNFNDSTGTLFIGFTLAEATVADGYPIRPTESLGIDIESGTSIYAVSDTGTVDVRLLQAGL